MIFLRRFAFWTTLSFVSHSVSCVVCVHSMQSEHSKSPRGFGKSKALGENVTMNVTEMQQSIIGSNQAVHDDEMCRPDPAPARLRAAATLMAPTGREREWSRPTPRRRASRARSPASGAGRSPPRAPLSLPSLPSLPALPHTRLAEAELARLRRRRLADAGGDGAGADLQRRRVVGWRRCHARAREAGLSLHQGHTRSCQTRTADGEPNETTDAAQAASSSDGPHSAATVVYVSMRRTPNPRRSRPAHTVSAASAEQG